MLLEQMSEADKERFKHAANKLLNSCFIVKNNEALKTHYTFISQKYNEFTEFFGYLGYELFKNDLNGVIGISNTFGTGRLHLKKYETITLLILRLIYIEKRKELTLNNQIIITVSEIHGKFVILNLNQKQVLDKTTLKETMRLFKKYNLIQQLDRDVIHEDARIILYPSILFAITNEDLAEVYETINNKLSILKEGRYIDEEIV